MKTLYLLSLSFLISISSLVGQEKLLDFPLEFDRNIQSLGQVNGQIFFRYRESGLSQSMWHYNSQTNTLESLTDEDDLFQDFLVINDRAYWVIKRDAASFESGSTEFWTWSGLASEEPILINSQLAKDVSFLGHQNGEIFTLYDDFKIFQLSTIDQSFNLIGQTFFNPIRDDGLIWEGGYYWIDNNSLFRIKAGEGGLTVANLNSGSRDIIALKDKLIWQDEDGLYAYDGENQAERFLSFSEQDLELGFMSLRLGVVLKDSVLFFSATTEMEGTELWRSNGTASGTYLFKDIEPGSTGENINNSFPHYLQVIDDNLYFFTFSPDFKTTYYWFSDGTLSGTIQIDNLTDAWGWHRVYGSQELPNGGQLLQVFSKEYGIELIPFNPDLKWYDVFEGPGSGFTQSFYLPYYYQMQDGTVLVAANDGVLGQEAWALKPNGEKTLIADISPGAAWSDIVFLGEEGFFVYCLAGNREQGIGLYRLDVSEGLSAAPVDNGLDWVQTMQSFVSAASLSFGYSTDLVKATDGSYFVGGSDNGGSCNIMFSHGESPVRLADRCYTTYLAKLDEDGKGIWQLSLPGSFVFSDMPILTAAPNGGVYAAGRIFSDGFIGDQPLDVSLGNVYLCHFDTDGNLLWLRQFTIPDGRTFRINSNTNGEVWLTGLFRQEANIGGQFISSEINPSFFAARFDAEGNAIWAKALRPNLNWSSWAPIRATRLDEQGNLWLVLNNVAHNFSAPCGFTDIFTRLVKLGPGGDILLEQEWKGDDMWYISDLELDRRGNILLAGRFRGELSLGQFDLSQQEEDCSSAGFLMKLRPNGQVFKAIKLEDGRIAEAILSQEDGTYVLAGYQELDEPESKPGFDHFPYADRRNRIFATVYDNRDVALTERSFLANGEFNSGGYIYLREGLEGQYILQTESSGPVDNLPSTASNLTSSSYLVILAFPLEYNFEEDLADGELNRIDIDVFPNPGPGLFILDSEDADIANTEFQVFNNIGQQVIASIVEFDTGIYQIDLRNLPAGQYMLVGRIGDELVTKKLMKH